MLLAMLCAISLGGASKFSAQPKPGVGLLALQSRASENVAVERRIVGTTSANVSDKIDIGQGRTSVFARPAEQSNTFSSSMTIIVCGLASLGLAVIWIYSCDYAGRSEDADAAEGTEAGRNLATGSAGEGIGRSVSKILAPPSSNHLVHGQIRFEEGSTQFCVTSNESDPQVLCEQLDSWFSGGPMLILSIFGGADEFDTDPYNFDLDAFSKGLVQAAVRTRAWVVTGGTKSGVMDLVGKAMRAHDKQRQVPCIGISPFGALTEKWRSLLLRTSLCDCSVVDARKAAREKLDADSLHDGTAIQDNHTHSILCDNGTQGKAAYGTEGNFRTAFEQFAATMLSDGAPRVMILVNGGMISVQMVAEQIRAGSCVVTCKGTGRAADALASLSQAYEDLEEEMTAQIAGQCLKEHMPTLKDKDVQIFLDIIQSRQLKVYSYEDRIQDVILSAVLSLKTSAAAIEHQLLLAVRWGCTDYFDLLGPKFVEFYEGGAVKRIFETLVAHTDISDLSSRSKLTLKPQETVNVAPLINWMMESYPELMRSVNVDRSWKGGVTWTGLGTRKKESWTGLEGLLLWAVENDATDSSLFAIWMHMEDPVHAALAMASALRGTALSYSSFSYQATLAKESLHERADYAERLAILFIKDLSSRIGISPAEYLFSVSKTWGNSTAFHLAKQLGCALFVEAKFYRSAVDVYWMTPHPFDLGKETLDYDFGILSGAYAYVFQTDRFSLGAWDTLSVPYVKAYTHGIMRVLFCLVYGWQVMFGEISYGGFTPMGGFLMFWAMGYIQLEITQFRHLGFRDYFADIWNILDFWHLLVFLSLVSASWTFTHDYSRDITEREQLLQDIHSLNLLPTFARLFKVCQYSEYFGTLLLTLFGLCVDAAYFFLMLGMFCATMSCALTPILWPSIHERWAHGITWGFWSIFGDVNSDAMHRAENLPSRPLRWLTLFLLYVLTLGSNILLVNLLIAIMNNTYTRYQEASKTHWASARVEAVLEFDDITTLPPPFNLLAAFLEQVAPALAKALKESKMQPVARPKFTINKKHLQESMGRVLCSNHVDQQLPENGGAGCDRGSFASPEELVKPESPSRLTRTPTRPFFPDTPAARGRAVGK